jgi:hypothetical protein
MWVKRILKENSGSWKAYPDMLLDKILGPQSFHCSLNVKSLKEWMPPFYREVFEAWNRTKVNPGEDPFKLRREVLWQNKYITVKDKVIYYDKWHDKGITILHDIIDENGAFKEIEVLSNQFDLKIGFMEYNSLKLAIPQAWKRAVKNMKIPSHAISNEEQPYLTCGNRLLALSIAKNRDVYWDFI